MRKHFDILKTKGAILRARCPWYNKGEKKVQCLKPRKRRFKNGVVNQLKIGEREFATTNKEILNEFESFYRKVYSSKIYDQEI